MPPKLKQFQTPFQMVTRPRNKTWNPGLPDCPDPSNPKALPKPAKTAEEIAQEEIIFTQAAKAAASMQDSLKREDEACEKARRERRAMNEANALSMQNSRHVLQNNRTLNIESIHDEDTGAISVPSFYRKPRKQAENERGQSVSRPYSISSSNGSGGNAGSDFEENESESSDNDSDNRNGNLTDELEELNNRLKGKRKSKSSHQQRHAKKKKTQKKRGRQDIDAMRKRAKSNDEKRTFFKSSKTNASDIHGLDEEWEEFLRQRASKPKVVEVDPRDNQRSSKAPILDTGEDDEDSGIQFGGMVPEGQTDEVEEAAINFKSKPVIRPRKANQEPYFKSMVKIEDNGAVQPKTKKEARGGDDKWKLKHLQTKENADIFTNAVAPRARRKAGTLGDPWVNLSLDEVQAIVDEVFGPDVHDVTQDGAWYGLVNARLHTWRGGFATSAMEAIDAFIIEEKLTTKDQIASRIRQELDKDHIYPGSKLHTYAYQWHDWDLETKERRGFGRNKLVLRTFAHAYLNSIEGLDDTIVEKPVGAMILAMQAVERALEFWKTGEKPNAAKAPPFSSDNFGDFPVVVDETAGMRGKLQKRILIRRATIFTATLQKLPDNQWEAIFDESAPFLKKKKSRDRSSSSIAPDNLEDPDAEFVMSCE